MIFDDWEWLYRDRVHLIWLVAALMIGLIVLELAGRDALGRFLSPLMQRRLVARPSTATTVARLILAAVAMVAGVLALMRPQAPGQTDVIAAPQAGADVMIVLDVSKSMLAEDVAPNRLTRARSEIAAMVRRLPGQRVGLIAFAGRATMVCPLTSDQQFFNLVLDGVDTRTVPKGGTRIGEAIRAAVKAFPTPPGPKLIVLITDGEDHESYPLEAAKQAKAAGVRIIAVGLGSEEGSTIVLTDPRTGAKTELVHDGQPVVSRLDGKTLAEMALETKGAYVPAGTSALDLESIVKQHITPILRAEADAATREVPAERYWWPVLAAMIALVASVAVGARRPS
ncbi:MAG TPA: VWA domain-containing protein [Kofleriaceae bacterium]|nr:VWA domain-containing protein [Kofleriaceae bacterium]